MKSFNIDENLKELSFEEASTINGGESLWYWVAYGAGAVAREVKDTVDFATENPVPAFIMGSTILLRV